VVPEVEDPDNNDVGFIYEEKGVIEGYSADQLEAVLGELRTGEQQARQDSGNEGGQDRDGDAESHHKDSFFDVVVKETKRQLYPFQFFKVLFCRKAASYDVIILDKCFFHIIEPSG
jgi:hypothetical protein